MIVILQPHETNEIISEVELSLQKASHLTVSQTGYCTNSTDFTQTIETLKI